MSILILLTGKSFIAYFTANGIVISMNSHMLCQIGASAETLETLRTFKGLDTAM